MEPGQRTIGRYVIERELGRGGMGVVYEAREQRLDRLVALKLIAPEGASDERFRERFVREARLAASLEHPGIVPIYAADEEAGQLYIAMRLVPGGDLAQLLADGGPLEPAAALQILGPVADALDVAHARGLVHRDVKPANILVEPRPGGVPHAYLTDFGLAREQGGGLMTQSGALVGTVEYMAPEQVKGDPVDGRADQYALGCVLFQVLCGRTPFAGGTHMQVLVNHLHAEPPTLSALRPDLPPHLDGVLRRALAKEPGERYASCRALLDAAGEAPVAEPLRVRRRRWPAALAACALVVVGAGLATWFSTRSPQRVTATGSGSIVVGRPPPPPPAATPPAAVRGADATDASRVVELARRRPDGVVAYRWPGRARQYVAARRGDAISVAVELGTGDVRGLWASFRGARLDRACYRLADGTTACGSDAATLGGSDNYASLLALRSVAELDEAVAGRAVRGGRVVLRAAGVACAGTPDGRVLLCVRPDGVVVEARDGDKHLVADRVRRRVSASDLAPPAWARGR